MDSLLIVLFFLLGLIFGSFFNVVGLRVPNHQPFTNERSICPHCQHTLAWHELVPVLSYIMQFGKCRHCQNHISFMYPVIELITGFLFAFSYAKTGMGIELVTALIVMSMLMIILVSDITYMLIPDNVLLFFLPLVITMRFIEPSEVWWSPVTGALTGILIIAAVILLSRGGMGAGDLKLFGILGIVFGVKKILMVFFLSCMIGAVIGMLLLITKMIDNRQPVPFGPYIVIASIITYFYGDVLIDSYFKLFI